MTFPITRHGGVVMVQAGRELSGRSGAELKQAVLEEIDRGGRQFVIDFNRTEFIDSAGLGALISISKSVNMHEGALRLMRLNEEMRRLFELTKLDTLFEVVSSGSTQGDDAEAAAVAPPGGGTGQSNLAH